MSSMLYTVTRTESVMAQKKKSTTQSSVVAKLALPDGSRVTTERVMNISLGGIFVELEVPLAFGAQLGVEFSLPGDSRVIRCEGMVIWSTKTSPDKAPGRVGNGVRLASIGIEEMRRLAQSVGASLRPA